MYSVQSCLLSDRLHSSFLAIPVPWGNLINVSAPDSGAIRAVHSSHHVRGSGRLRIRPSLRISEQPYLTKQKRKMADDLQLNADIWQLIGPSSKGHLDLDQTQVSVRPWRC